MQATTYNGMMIEYSGYFGVENKAGKEYIKINGEVKSPLQIRILARENGKANVEYSWGNSRSPCCLGAGACGSIVTNSEGVTFSAAVAANTEISLGIYCIYIYIYIMHIFQL